MIYNAFLDEIQSYIGDSTTYTDQLMSNGKRMFGDQFIGVFASDQIPSQIDRGDMMIVNLDAHNEPGSHWVAICKDEKDIIWVYDSFGRNIHRILPSIYNGTRKIKSTERDPEQEDTESNCGARCLAFLQVFYVYGSKYARYI